MLESTLPFIHIIALTALGFLCLVTNRRSYMILAGLIGSSGWFYLANYANTPFEATAASIVASLGVAISDVVADSIVVEKVRPDFIPTTQMLPKFQEDEAQAVKYVVRLTARLSVQLRQRSVLSCTTYRHACVFCNVCYKCSSRQARDSESQAVSGGLQSLCWGSAAVGGIASSYFSGALLERMTTREVFSLTTYLPFLITVCALFIDEKRRKESIGR